MTTAFLLVGVHGFTALPILLSLNTYSIWLGLACVLPTLVYPYMKRVTNWPQLYLGLVFNWGALLGYAAVQGYCDWSVVLPLYVSCVSWTVFYDTVYGHQDRDDDAKLGLKSTSISFANYTKPFLSVFLLAMTSGLTISGLQSAQTWPYHLAVVGSAAFLGKQVWSVNVNDRQQCGNMFRDSWWIGLLMFIGITISTLLKHDSVEKSGKVHENGNSSNGQ
jgi:4-hydroxybenzoate polyprenyltransferase